MTKVLRMGTRGSRLALAQSGLLAASLEKKTGVQVEVVQIVSRGDRIQDRPLSEIGGKGLFIKAIDDALLAGEVDFAVHSMKDLPYAITEGTVLAAIPERASPFDVIIGNATDPATIGTGSPRRALQLQALYPAAAMKPIRGNIDTRIGRVGHADPSQRLDAVVLAEAGLQRLQPEVGRTVTTLNVDQCIPAAGQGLLAVTARAGSEISSVLEAIDDPEARAMAALERQVLAHFEADCTLPVAAWSRCDGDHWVMDVGLFAEGREKRARWDLPLMEPGGVLHDKLALFLHQGGAEILAQHKGKQ